MTRTRLLLAAVGCLTAAGPLVVALLLALLLVSPPAGFRAWAWARETAGRDVVAPAGRFVEADGLRIYVQEHGPVDGPAVLLVHGTGAWSGTWRDTQAALAEAGYRVVALDLPPFGFSERPDPSSYDRPSQARRILAVADAVGADRFALVGHSFGGGPTVEAAMIAEDRVWALVLVSAALSLDTARAEPALLEIPWLRETAVASTFCNPLLTGLAVRHLVHDPADATPDRIALYQQPLSVEGTTSAVGAWLPELAAPDRSAASLDPEAYRSLDVETLLVWGLEDTTTPPAQAERLLALLPRARVTWLDEVGHIPHIEDPDAVHRALLPFLQSTSTSHSSEAGGPSDR